MPGELWQEVWQIGREAIYGTAVPATRRVYVGEPSLTIERASRPRKFATGTRDNQRAHTLGPRQVSGKLSMAVSPDEMLEWLECALGAATISTPAGATNGRQHLYRPLNVVPSMTIERHDGARLRRGTGIRVSKITLSGSVGGENKITFDLFGRDLVTLGALTGGLAERVPSFFEGWETRLFIDALGATPGVTLIGGTLLSWTIEVDLKPGRKYTADNTLAANGITLGELGVTAKLKFEAASPQAAVEFANWDAEVPRLPRLLFGTNDVIDAGTSEVQTITISGTPTGGTFTLTFRGQTTGNLAYNATAATVQAALEGLTSVGAGNVVIGGGPGPGTPYTATFAGQLAGTDVPQMTAAHAFTGGTSPAIAVTTTTPGAGSRKQVYVDVPGAWSAIDLNQEDEGTRAYEMSLQYLYDATNAFGVQFGCITDRTASFA